VSEVRLRIHSEKQSAIVCKKEEPDGCIGLLHSWTIAQETAKELMHQNAPTCILGSIECSKEDKLQP